MKDFKMKTIKCSRCGNQIGKNFVWLQEEELLLHERCHKHHLNDIRNKDLYKRRKNGITKPASGGLPQ